MYYYYRELKLDESIESKKLTLKGANKWWKGLSDNEKILAEKTLGLMFKQRNCEHVWGEYLYYDIPIECCSKCDLEK